MGRIATCLFRRFVRERLSLRGVDVVVTDFAAGLPRINPFKNTCRLSACLTEPVFDGGALALPECSVEFTRCGVASVDISVTAGDYGAVFFKKRGNDCYLKAVCAYAGLGKLLPEELGFDSINNYKSEIELLAYYRHDDSATFPRVIAQTKGAEHLADCFDSKRSAFEIVLAALVRRRHLGGSYAAYDSLPSKMISALICTEDPAFTLHKGVCPYALGSISADLCSGRMPSKGGSSLTQQLAKNAFFKSERSVVRKVRELVTALVLEVVLGLSKREIIELYLNMAEFGAGVYGVVDAARHYFGKESGDISDLEAIVLTYILPRPLFFEEALLSKTERLRANLSAHIERFAQSLAVKERPDGSVERFYANGVINFAEPFGAL